LSFLNKRTVYPLVVPAALILVSAWLVWQWPGLLKHVEGVQELRAFMLILPLLPYVFFSIGMILGWRLNHAGLILTSLALGLTYFAMSYEANLSYGRHDPPVSIPEATRILLPLNLAFFAVLTRRRLLTPVGLLFIGLILFQVFVLLLVSQTLASPLSQLIQEGKAAWPLFYRILVDSSTKMGAWLYEDAFREYKNISLLAVLSFAGSFVFMALRFYRSRDALSAGSLGSLVAAYLGLTGYPPSPSSLVYFSAAGLMLLVSAVDSSFSMAYLDELTGLPARRSLNYELANLGKRYVIAMIDIDHFKKFNDQYGHKTGDQVLKMIASKLKDITGGAKVFRYGGEEFTAVFPRKSLEEALPHLDVYRQIIESTPFVVRGTERRVRSAEKKGQDPSQGQKKAKVTVSVGAAAPGKELATPERVLKAADRALYKAKKAGRNRVAT
jgi:diguanylate cyclase (GGDEF)-like protein